MISALILAAGMSTRMEDFKPLLPLKGKTMIETTIGNVFAGGVEKAVVVTGYRGAEIEELLSGHFGKRLCFVRNEEYQSRDMLYSIKTGVRVLRDCDGFFLVPGDMPVIDPRTFQLLQSRWNEEKMVIFPTLDGYRKHPPLINARFIPSILNHNGEGGLRSLWSMHEDRILEVPVDDPGVWVDLDTQQDYRRYREVYEGKGYRTDPESSRF